MTVAGEPPAEVTVGGADVLPVTTLYSLHIVVADIGTAEEHHVVVTVSMRPLGSTGNPVSSSASASIGAGQFVSFHPPGARGDARSHVRTQGLRHGAWPNHPGRAQLPDHGRILVGDPQALTRAQGSWTPGAWNGR